MAASCNGEVDPASPTIAISPHPGHLSAVARLAHSLNNPDVNGVDEVALPTLLGTGGRTPGSRTPGGRTPSSRTSKGLAAGGGEEEFKKGGADLPSTAEVHAQKARGRIVTFHTDDEDEQTCSPR